MGFFGSPKIDGKELQECLTFFEAETKIIAFQTKEADLYNNVMVQYSNSIMEDRLAASEAYKAAKRLVQAAKEILRRHKEIKNVPDAASAMYLTWHVTFVANEAWASATAASIEAMSKGMSPNTIYVQQLVEEYQEAWRMADDEDKKFVKRLKASAGDLAKIVNRATTIGAKDDWEPKIADEEIMPISESKPKISIEECCRQFYDENIFHSILAGHDAWAIMLDGYVEAISEVDPSFLSIDREVFYREMTALRLEMFGLAWGHKFKQEKFTIPPIYYTSPQKAVSEKFPHDIIFSALFEEFAIPQSTFTRKYLEENGKLDTWDIMGEYNKAIAQSTTISESGEVTDAELAAKVNVARAAFAKKWLIATLGTRRVLTEEEQIVAICVGRVTNRIGADIHREDKGVNVTLGLLSGIIAHRLGYDVNPKPEALILLGSIALGFYNGAEEYLNSVDLG